MEAGFPTSRARGRVSLRRRQRLPKMRGFSLHAPPSRMAIAGAPISQISCQFPRSPAPPCLLSHSNLQVRDQGRLTLEPRASCRNAAKPAHRTPWCQQQHAAPVGSSATPGTDVRHGALGEVGLPPSETVSSSCLPIQPTACRCVRAREPVLYGRRRGLGVVGLLSGHCGT